MRGLVAGVACALVCGPAAEAKTSYAAPDGSGTACTAEAPCAITRAAEVPADGGVLAAGDTVVLRPGSYELGARSLGDAAQGVVLAAEVPGTVTLTGEGSGGGLVRVGAGSTVRGLRLVGRGGARALVAQAAGPPRVVLEQLVVESAGAEPVLLFGGQAVLRDAVVLGCGGGTGYAVIADGGAAASLRNVTALAEGTAVLAAGSGTTLGARNVLARSTGAAGFDLERALEAQSLAVAHTSNRTARASRVTRIGEVHLSDVDPQVDAATGRLAIGSPLRDAGDPAATDLGTSDSAGRPRVIGGAPDVGAFELLGRPVVTAAVRSAGTDRATIGGTVDPAGAPVAVRLEGAGRTIELGTLTASGEVAGELAGLAPDSPFTARLVARNADGEVAAEVAFRTAAVAGPAPGPGPIGGDTGTPVLLREARLRARAFRRRGSTALETTTLAGGRTVLEVLRRLPGRRSGARCTARGRGPRCAREVRVLRSEAVLPDGRATRRFAPRRRGRPLPAGRYVLRLTLNGRTLRLPFTLRR